jgi:hypothetical protein
MKTTYPQERTSHSQAGLFGTEEVQKKKKIAKKATQPQKEQVSPLYEEVMKLGNTHRYKRLEVNDSLIIGAGPEGWHAYAVKAVEKRVREIERAIQGEAV